MSVVSWFSFEGRMRRSRWWLTQLALLLGPGVAFFAAVYVTSTLERTLALQAIIGVGAAAVFGFIVWVNLAASIRRFHDQNLSGWFYLLNLIPFIGQFIVLALLGFRAGTAGANRFGPPLKALDPVVAETFS
jgi:uncharacterized membrane protein YhaH (DUF805 family)